MQLDKVLLLKNKLGCARVQVYFDDMAYTPFAHLAAVGSRQDV